MQLVGGDLIHRGEEEQGGGGGEYLVDKCGMETSTL